MAKLRSEIDGDVRLGAGWLLRLPHRGFELEVGADDMAHVSTESALKNGWVSVVKADAVEALAAEFVLSPAEGVAAAEEAPAPEPVEADEPGELSEPVKKGRKSKGA